MSLLRPLPICSAYRRLTLKRGYQPFTNENSPHPDPTTGLYCIEAVERWRLLRHPQLFPELTAAPTAAHAGTIFDERLRRFHG